ncbi:MAG TPA: tRNA (adenosine(37)-N6)-threonylcarbamoyltransferase complex dimerization subunit type 1 TsaB [Candidatus Solibacter sp.]|nr:tRNA (adenosine(37)-N6)-threonylcarbamoyltransferase complex dimerization subunit type 1 TsaB [Candidatus Solibacter sp.]
MPLILALDTTNEYGSIALVRVVPSGAETLEEQQLHEPAGFSKVLFARLDALLTRHGVKPADIDGFAGASGPGSFTGVRVGLACIKGLAEALAKPAIAVSNLEALARFGTAPLRAVWIDARREEVYGAVYDASGDLVRPEVVMRHDDWRATLPPEAELLSGLRPLAATIARIAAERLARGDRGDPAEIDANYVRRSDAELLFRPFNPLPHS